MLGFAVVASMLAGLLAGLLPALQITQPRLLDVLKNGAGGSASKGRARMALVVGGTALAFVLASGAGLMIRTLSINLVSRGIAAPDILQGIHIAIAGRLARLVGSAHIEGILALTGGLALDAGLVEALRGELEKGMSKTPPPELRAAPEAVQAGAIGAAFLGALRSRQLAERRALAQAG